MTINDEVGRDFELEVLKALKEGLSKRLFGLDPKYWTAFHGKKYFSRDRSSPIEVDLSIEYRMPNATAPSILWIWECKALSRPVDVPELEKFHSQLEQIGADNTKGTVIAKGRLSQ